MMSPFRFRLALCAAAAFFSAAVFADPPPPPKKPDTPPAKAEDAPKLPAASKTTHTIELGGRQRQYVATAGALPVYGAKQEITAQIFYVDYKISGEDKRPVTFVFNGGPGAASAFLHLGGIGPRMVRYDDTGVRVIQPVELSDNPDSWLDFSDLVFVDPVGTGFSQATGGAEAEKAFFGVEKDADALTSFIRRYLTREGRDLAPVFLAGESYGGFRVPLIANRLLKNGIQVKGLTLISPALEFAMLRGDSFLLTPLVFQLPSITASVAETRDGPNGSLDPVHEAETFARNGYLTMLASGNKPDDASLQTLSRFTGLSPQIIARHNGQASVDLFMREYKRAHDRSLSIYDGTVSAPLPQPSDGVHFDPILDGASAVLQAAMTRYARSELGFETDLQYRLLNRSVSGNWDYGTKPNQQGYAGALEDLQKARTINPSLRILIAHGYTDLVTPYAASQFLAGQLEPIDGAAPVQVKVYRGGHMMYFRPQSRQQLKADVAGHYRAALLQ